MVSRKLIAGCLYVLLCGGVLGLNLNVRTKYKFKNVMVLKHFWKNTGLSPASDPELRANFFLSHDEKLNFDFIGALPNGAIRTVRIHWLLDLVTVSNAQSEKPTFHLEKLDQVIDKLYRNNLTPDFELMGNPSNFFRNFTEQSEHWTSLVEKIIKHYTSLYGAHYLHGWRFELMNEPDLKQYNRFNFTLEQYLEYFRASEKAVPSLAGPAGLFKNMGKTHPLCWGFLGYCNSNPCNLNMITFHRKGGEVGSKVVEESIDLINTLISRFPGLKGVPFGNNFWYRSNNCDEEIGMYYKLGLYQTLNEADIMTGWSTPREWRADVRYAALVVQVIIGHIYEMFVRRNIPFEALSYDNAFLSFSPNYFTQRTLLARFQMNNTTPKHVQFFRKPVYSVMGLLSLLGDYLIYIHYYPGKKGYSYLGTSYRYEDTFLGVLTDDRVTNETYLASYVDVNVRIAVGNLTLSGVCVGYVMDNDMNSPYHVWMNAGSPDFPDAALRRRMREAEGFRRIFHRRVKPHQTELKFYLRDTMVPSVLAVHTCFEGTEEPGQVTDLHYVNVTSDEIILFWRDTFVNSRCILTYVVEFKKVGDTDFHRINKNDFIFLSYHHDGVGENGSKLGIAGDYRVAAVDYWNRFGPFSDSLTVLG